MQQVGQSPFGINQSSHNPLNSLLMSNAGISSASGGSGLSSGGTGRNSTGGSGLSSNLMSQLGKLASSASSTAEAPAENMSALTGGQRLLGFGNSQRAAGNSLAPGPVIAGRGLYHQSSGPSSSNIESGGVSDALSLLARAIPRGDSANSHGFGGIPDRQDGM